MLRPARGSDAHSMQLMFHRMSSEDVYMRFFRRASALSYDEAQRLCNVDFDKDVAFVAVTGPRDNEPRRGSAAAPQGIRGQARRTNNGIGVDRTGHTGSPDAAHRTGSV